jgi:hypothetical protein
VGIFVHFPALLDIRDPPRHPENVERPLANDLVRDVDIAALRIPRLRPIHARENLDLKAKARAEAAAYDRISMRCPSLDRPPSHPPLHTGTQGDSLEQLMGKHCRWSDVVAVPHSAQTVLPI